MLCNIGTNYALVQSYTPRTSLGFSDLFSFFIVNVLFITFTVMHYIVLERKLISELY